MQTATLVISSIGCVFAIGAFGVSLKTALELQKAKKVVDTEINNVKGKITHNAGVVKTALDNLDFS
jgi:Zn-dependent alcohol dehydrogenase